jgi:hypothetical protein
VTPRHVPSVIAISIEKRVGADTQFALGNLALRTLAGGLLAYGHT